MDDLIKYNGNHPWGVIEFDSDFENGYSMTSFEHEAQAKRRARQSNAYVVYVIKVYYERH